MEQELRIIRWSIVNIPPFPVSLVQLTGTKNHTLIYKLIWVTAACWSLGCAAALIEGILCREWTALFSISCGLVVRYDVVSMEDPWLALVEECGQPIPIYRIWGSLNVSLLSTLAQVRMSKTRQQQQRHRGLPVRPCAQASCRMRKLLRMSRPWPDDVWVRQRISQTRPRTCLLHSDMDWRSEAAGNGNIVTQYQPSGGPVAR
jgi:hypothetical protein